MPHEWPRGRLMCASPDQFQHQSMSRLAPSGQPAAVALDCDQEVLDGVRLKHRGQQLEPER